MGPFWYYNPRQAFPKSKMMKGRSLGFARNVGDAFCYLILTQPEDESESENPQVLTRSVIRRLYVREETPVAERDNQSDSIIFYKSDGITPLEAIDEDSEEVDALRDVILPPDEVENLQHTSGSELSSGSSSDNPFENGIIEVYGPLTKRPRLSDVPLPTQASETFATTDTQHSPTSSPTPSTTLTYEHNPVPQPVSESTKVLATTSTEENVCPIPTNTTALPTVDPNDDDRCDARDGAMRCIEEPVPITEDEDEDVAPSTLNEITHQLHRTAEDHEDDEHVDSVMGHEWKDGVLMFQIKWKTDDETLLLPFSIVKRDSPWRQRRIYWPIVSPTQRVIPLAEGSHDGRDSSIH